MKCKKCQHENPPGSTFCSQCGAKLSDEEEPSESVTKTMETKGEGFTRGTIFAERY